MTDSITKRKRPPTFQHYPAKRAKVLKKQWIEKAKIKSQWKAQKRKEDLLSRSQLEVPTYSDDESAQNLDGPDDTKDGVKRALHPPHEPAPRIQPSRLQAHPNRPVSKAKQLSEPAEGSKRGIRPEQEQKISKEEKDNTESAPQSSVRELMREAYSPSTLHTYKADPLKKRRLGSSSQSNGQTDGRSRQTGKGQPNMKLRMNAMLAKIKRDYT